MSALVLYLLTTIGLLLLWSRFVQRVSFDVSVALLLLPLCFVGAALLTGRVYAPIDLPFMSEPLKGYAAHYGVGKVYNGTLSDLYSQMIPWRQAVRFAYAHGRWPLLDPFMLSGDILAASAQPAAYDPLNVLSLVIPLAASVTYSAAMTFFLAAMFTFAFARSLAMSEEASLVSAAIWMACGDLLFFVGWPLGRAWAFLPLILYAVRRVVRDRTLGGALLLTIGFVALILAGHPESILHVVAVGAAWGLFELVSIREGRLRALGLAAGAGVAALLLTAIQLLPFLEAVPQTLDHQIRLKLASAPFFHQPLVVRTRLASTFLPFYSGRSWMGSTASGFDPQTVRVGSIAFALVLLAALLGRRRRETWFFLFFGAVAFLAAIDAPPVAQALHALPLFDLALNERLGFAAAFAFAVLAGIAVDSIATKGDGLPAKDRRAAAVIFAVVGLMLALITWRVWPSQQTAGVPGRWIRGMVLLELLPLLLLVVLMLAKVRPKWLAAAVLGLVLIQRVGEDGSIYPVLPMKAFYPRVPLLRMIPHDEQQIFRITALNFALIPDTAALYGLEDTRGYDAMNFRRMAETYAMWAVPQPISFNAVPVVENPFLTFLNVRYAIGSKTDPTPPGWKLIWEDVGGRLFENLRPLPRAFIPRRVAFEPSAVITLSQMSKASDFSQRAWLEIPGQPRHEIDNGRGQLAIRRHGWGFDIAARMERDGWIVLSQPAWKGWRASIDGRRVHVDFANHAFLGVFVPRGTHRVVVDYLPDSFLRGRLITFASLGILLVALASWGLRRRRVKDPSLVGL